MARVIKIWFHNITALKRENLAPDCRNFLYHTIKPKVKVIFMVSEAAKVTSHFAQTLVWLVKFITFLFLTENFKTKTQYSKNVFIKTDRLQL